jgi:uncharacterized protein
MTLATTSLYAAILTVIMIALSSSVSARRGKAGISILHGDDMGLALAIRRHGNFTENVPMALILIVLAELNGAPGGLLHGCGLMLVASRIAHPIGLSVENASAPLRIAGGALTTLSMLAAIGFLGWKSVG